MKVLKIVILKIFFGILTRPLKGSSFQENICGQTFFLIIKEPYPTKEGRRTADRLQCACCENMTDSRYYCVRLGRQLFIGYFGSTPITIEAGHLVTE